MLNIFSGYIAVGAVSYTHLDVYKRQSSTIVTACDNLKLSSCNGECATVDLGVVTGLD